MTTLPQQVAALVHTASDNEISAAQALVDGASLISLGLGSLGFLRLVDAVEQTYGVELDLAEGFVALDQVAWIAEHLTALGVRDTVDDPR